MANEYLRRTPTSTGNRKKFTIAFWTKKGTTDTFQQIFSCTNHLIYHIENAPVRIYDGTNSIFSRENLSDRSSLYHIIFSVDTTKDNSSDRVRVYINGVDTTASGTFPTKNFEYEYNSIITHFIGTRSSLIQYHSGSFSDVFFVDGQALTPDVFGFYKQGKGYISAGSTQATDFRPGQWVPKSPRVIKTEINRRGGFGVNGFYLPMNDSRNFGADFHGDPNSIITLNEKLPQPRVGVATTASVGLGYTDALRADPYAANLVLAVPGVIGGQGSGYGDYSANIKGSGTNKTVTANGNAGVAVTASYYGSALSFDGSGDYLTIPASSDLDFGTGDFTAEFWLWSNPGNGSAYRRWLTTTNSSFGSGTWVIRENAGGTDKAIGIQAGNIGPANSFQRGQWNHIAWTRYGKTESVYVNGVSVGILTNSTYNYNEGATNGLYIGGFLSPNSEYFDGYLQDLRIYKGVAKYTGGFDVPRPYTPVGIATWRAVPDTTANNFATWNPLSAFDGTQTNGNLTSTTNDLMGTVGVSTGKWYWEIYDTTAVGGGGNVMHHGVSFGNYNRGIGGGFSNAAEGFLNIRMDGVNQSTSGTTITITSQTGTVPTYSNGDIYAIALDLDNGQVRHYRNGSVILTTNFNYNRNTQAIPYTRNNGLSCSANFGQNPTFSGNTTAGTFTDSNGKGLFKYQPPSGFLALCEDNLPTPAISNPGQYFKTVLWTGDGNNGRSIVGVGFTPDLVWIKSRTTAYNHRAFDSVRGAGKDNFLMPNSTAVEGASSDYYGGISSFNNDGFSMVYGTGGSNIGINESGTNFVAWCWRAGAGTTSTNTDGSITSVVSVNQTAGFSIVSYTGTGANATVGHGLGKAPSFIIVKSRNDGASNWQVYHSRLGNTQYISLNLTNAAASTVLAWNNTSPTSTVFSVGTSGSINGAAASIIAYCWAEIEGFSKFGSYSANFSADGPFCYCGFRPAFVIIKRTDSTGSWVLKDSSRNSANPADLSILAQTSDTEFSNNSPIDFLSNGFKLRSTSLNDSGATFIFAAWAESPFQTANSK